MIKTKKVIIVLFFVSRIVFSQSPIWSVSFNADGSLIAAGTYQWVIVWNVETEKVIQIFEDHADAVRCVKFLDDRYILAGGGSPSEFGELKFWIVDPEELPEPLLDLQIHGDVIESIAVIEKGIAITASSDETLQTIHIQESLQMKTLTHHVDRVFAVAASPNDRFFATGSADETIKVCTVEDRAVFANLNQHEGPIFSISFLNNNLFASSGADNTIRSWRIGRNRVAQTRIFNGHRDTVYAVDCGFRDDQRLIVSGSADSSVIVWNFDSGNRVRTFDQPTDEVYAVDLGPDGDLVAAGGRDGVLRIWSLENGKLISELKSE